MYLHTVISLDVLCCMRVDSLPYVEATILELSRYKTLAPFSMAHRTLRDTDVGGYFIPAGTMVSFHIYTVALSSITAKCDTKE